MSIEDIVIIIKTVIDYKSYIYPMYWNKWQYRRTTNEGLHFLVVSVVDLQTFSLDFPPYTLSIMEETSLPSALKDLNCGHPGSILVVSLKWIHEK